jgi:hypothetical protein
VNSDHLRSDHRFQFPKYKLHHEEFLKDIITRFFIGVSADNRICPVRNHRYKIWKDRRLPGRKHPYFQRYPIRGPTHRSPEMEGTAATRYVERGKKMRGFLCQSHTGKAGSVPLLVKGIYSSARAAERRLSLSECLDGCIVGV